MKGSILLFISITTATQLTWDDAYKKAKSTLETLSLDDKIAVVSGLGWKSPCVGNIAKVDKIPGFTGLCLQDGPAGVRFQTGNSASAFTSSINVASTWDKTLFYQNGLTQGQEFHQKGVNIALTPMMNIARAAAGGRNWEGFGEDPYLSSIASAETIKGLQSTGVMATAKHFFGNEQEHFREDGTSEIGGRALREIYLPPFQAAVDAGVAAVMCSYNHVLMEDGEWGLACEHKGVLEGVLKGELGFRGFVVSDWWAAHDAAKAANNGLDMMMAGDTFLKSNILLWGPKLKRLVEQKQVNVSRVDEMVTRVLSSWYKLGQDKPYPKVNFDSFNQKNDQKINVRGTHAQTIRKIGAASIILLKNDNNGLPLSQNDTLSIIGDNARTPTDPNSFDDRGGVDGHVAIGWGSGTANFPYLVGPLDAIKGRGNIVRYFPSKTAVLDSVGGSDAAVVFVYANSGEAYITVQGNAGDRKNLQLWDNGNDLILRVANKNKRTIVVITSPGPIEMTSWINHPNITSVILALFPGQESGNAIADILYGTVNPSGRLPFTIATDSKDYVPIVTRPPGNVVYSEGIFVGYRYFDKFNKKPLFPFGFGLSYTEFEYSQIELRRTNVGVDLDEFVITVLVNLKNIGVKAGAEVVQLYIGLPESANSAPMNLKGFEKVFLEAGEVGLVEFLVKSNDVRFWDVASVGWRLAGGTYVVKVGASSRDFRLTTSFSV